MTADARASLADLARLKDEISADRRALSRCLDDMRTVVQAWGPHAVDRAHLALAAVALHGYYSALEAIIERAARILDSNVPSGETWHRDLLSQGMTEIPGVRPAILPRELYGELVALLEFRHFFRHAYAVELDASKLRQNLDRALVVDARVSEALDEFRDFLTRAMKSLSG